MSLEKTFEKFSVNRLKTLQEKQLAVECNITVEDEIGKVLSVIANTVTDEPQVVGGEVTLNGRIVLNILYLTKDGLINNVESTCPFTYKDNLSGNDRKVLVKMKVLETNVDNVGTNNIKVVALLEPCITEIYNEEVEVFASAGEDVCQKETEVKYDSLERVERVNFTENTEIAIKEKVKKILAVENYVCVKDVTPGYNFVSVQGDLISRITYIVDDEREKLINTYAVNNFKEELEVADIDKDTKVDVKLDIVYDNVRVTLDTKNEETLANIEVPLIATIITFSESTKQTVVDLYSTNCELTCTTNSFTKTELLFNDYFENKVEGSLTLDDDYPRIDKYMCSTACKVLESNIYIKENQTFVEGICSCTVIYLNDETGIHSVDITIPFVVSSRLENEKEDMRVCGKLTLTDVDVMVKKGRDIYFDAKVKANVSYYADKEEAVITDITEGDLIKTRETPLEIYFAKKGDYLWDVAKSLKVKDSQLFVQNPDLTDPLEKDEKIVLYFQKSPKNDI